MKLLSKALVACIGIICVSGLAIYFNNPQVLWGLIGIAGILNYMD
jgi:hypothetical protein